jgi:trk system potassium uptake protein
VNILILGAGQVGSAVAEHLISENTDITIVDTDDARLRYLQDRMDINTVCGDASYPSVLERAGAKDADLLLAVTRSDQTNLVACKLASTLFHTPTKVARIRTADFLARQELFSTENFAVDLAICPEQIITDYIVRLVEYPEALQVIEFANGLLQLVAIRAFHGGPLVGHELQDLRQHMPQIDTRVVAIFRSDRALIPEGHTVIEAEDEVFFLAAKRHIRAVMGEMRRMDKPVKRVMIAGGGNIGRRLAKALEPSYQVRIIEINKPAAQSLAAELDRSLVLMGDATDEDLLNAEGVADMDLFCALTNDDENNIMSSLLAKRLGVRRVITLINRRAYVNLLQGDQIDIAISPAQATIGSLLTHVRRGDITAVHSLRRGAAEALEMVAHGELASSKVVGRRIDEIDWPRGATVGAIVRHAGNQSEPRVIMAHHDTVVESDDHVIVFVTNKRLVPKIEKLFQVSLGYF